MLIYRLKLYFNSYKNLLVIALTFLVFGLVINQYELEIFGYFRESFDIDSQNFLEKSSKVSILFSIALVILSFWRQHFKNILKNISEIICSWAIAFVESICGRNGYLVIASLIGIYITSYSLVESKAARDLTAYFSQYSIFVSLLSSGNNIAFKNAIAMVPKLYCMEITKDPIFFEPSSWMNKEFPLKNVIPSMLSEYLSNCDSQRCGKGEFRIDFSGVYFSDIQIYYVDFTKSNFKSALVMDAEIFGSNFSYANLDNVQINRSKLQPEQYSDGGYGTQSSFNSASIKNAIIQDSDLSGSTFEGAVFYNTLLNRATFKNCSFKKSVIMDSTFENSDLTGADLSEADLVNVAFKNTIYDDLTKFPVNFIVADKNLIKQ